MRFHKSARRARPAVTLAIYNTVGWFGIAAVITAYGLTTFGVLAPVSPWYGLLNVVGSAGIIASSYAKRDFQPVVLNAIWIVIAMIGLVRAVAH